MREKQQRPDWTTYFLDIARAVGRRATCLRRRYGAIIVKDHIIVSTGYNGERLWVNREYRTQFWESACFCKLAGAVIRMVLPVRLSYAHVQLTRTNRVDVVNRTTGTFYRTTDSVLFTIFVYQTADCTTCRIVNTCYTTGTDGDEVLSLCTWCHCEQGGETRTHDCIFYFHRNVSLPNLRFEKLLIIHHQT